MQYSPLGMIKMGIVNHDDMVTWMMNQFVWLAIFFNAIFTFWIAIVTLVVFALLVQEETRVVCSHRFYVNQNFWSLDRTRLGKNIRWVAFLHCKGAIPFCSIFSNCKGCRLSFTLSFCWATQKKGLRHFQTIKNQVFCEKWWHFGPSSHHVSTTPPKKNRPFGHPKRTAWSVWLDHGDFHQAPPLKCPRPRPGGWSWSS